MTPEQEEQVRRALAAAGRDDPAGPPADAAGGRRPARRASSPSWRSPASPPRPTGQTPGAGDGDDRAADRRRLGPAGGAAGGRTCSSPRRPSR